MRRIPASLAAGALLALSALAAFPEPDANAAGPKKKPAEVAPQASLDPATFDRLRSGDFAQVKSALDDVRMAGKGAQSAAPAVAEALAKGLPTELTIAAIETLADVEGESASPAVAAYASHRNLAIRQAAVKTLIKTKGAVAVSTLRHSLSDQDAMVRGIAATGLGTLKAKEAVGDLFVALDHRVSEAAASIGQLCVPEECDRLASELGKLQFDVVTGGLDQVLFRPAAEISDDEKVKIIGRVRELGTKEANKFLHDVQSRWPKGWSMRVKQSIDQGVLATGGGGL